MKFKLSGWDVMSSLFVCQVPLARHVTDRQKHISQSRPLRMKRRLWVHTLTKWDSAYIWHLCAICYSLHGWLFYLLCLLLQTHLHHITIPLFPCHWHSLSLSSFSTKPGRFLSSSLRLTFLKHQQNTAFLRLDKAVITGLSDPARGVITKADSSIQGQWMYEDYL